jgi:hypothetical protein
VDAGAQVGGGFYCAGCVAAGLGGLLGGLTLAWGTIGGTPPRRKSGPTPDGLVNPQA